MATVLSLPSDQISLAALAAPLWLLTSTVYSLEGAHASGAMCHPSERYVDGMLDLIQASPALCSETPEDDSSEPLSNVCVLPS